MGVEIGALIDSGRVPSRELWQGAIDALGLPVQLPDAFDPGTDQGSRDFTFDGETVGVEVGCVSAVDRAGWKEVTDALGRSRRRRIGDRDTFISFRWGSSSDAAVCANAAVAGLAVLADAKVWDLEADEILDASGAVALARSSAEAATRERDHDRPLRAREAARLWRTHLVPALEEATGQPVKVHGWTVVIGPVGWFARMLFFDPSKGADRRAVETRVLLPQLYGFIHPWAITSVTRSIGGSRWAPESFHLPADPGKAQTTAMGELTSRILSETVPHLERHPDLASLAAANEAALRDGDYVRAYMLDNLAGAYLIGGDDDRAIETYRRLFELFEGRAAERGGVDQLYDYEQRLRDRGLDMQDLIIGDRPAAVSRLADHARANAAEARIGEPDLPPA